MNMHNSHILWLSTLVIGAILALLANKYRQSTVLGQLLIGAFIGILAHFHIAFFADLVKNSAIGLLAQLGSILLLFEIGLESHFNDIKNAGKHAVLVAATGVVIPFCLGYFIVTPYIIDSSSHNLALFIGGVLAVTSTSISVSVFKELGILRQRACQIVLTASVIDDVLGLILLSIITAIISSGSINHNILMLMAFKVCTFFILCYLMAKYILPQLLLPQLSRFGRGENAATLFIIAVCLSMSWFAETIGLADIIGAFFAGLILDYEQFAKNNILPKDDLAATDNNILKLVMPLGRILTPIFFIYAGMQVDLVSAFKLKTIFMATIISIFAIGSKAASGIFLPKKINRLLVGFGMVPRGEIGVIFAITGLNIGVVNNELFTTILLVIVITSIITPIALNKIAANIKG